MTCDFDHFFLGSHVSDNSQPEYNGEHACEGADPKRENGYVQ